MKRVLLAVLLGVVAVGAQSPSPGQAAYEKANALFSAQRFQECMNALDDALRLDPKLVPALTAEGQARHGDQAIRRGTREFGAGPGGRPESAYAQFLYGFHFYEQNQMPAAITALEKARQLNPRDARAALYLGLARESQGDTQRALALYSEAIRLEQAAGKPQTSTLLTTSGSICVLGEFDEAASLIDRALKLEPASRDAHFQSARLRMKKGNPRRRPAKAKPRSS